MAGTDFTKLVPGFDFLQGLMKNAGAGLPNMSQWIAPTLDPAEIEKRISELRTVQFWLEQNAKMLGATIQALEVQRMTLATLRTMNLPLTEMGNALKISPKPAPEPPPAEPAPEPAPEPAATGRSGRSKKAAAPPAAGVKSEGATGGGVVDPMQWWGALTRQFTELATQALKEGPAEAARQQLAKTAEPPARARKSAPRKSSTGSSG